MSRNVHTETLIYSWFGQMNTNCVILPFIQIDDHYQVFKIQMSRMERDYISAVLLYRLSCYEHMAGIPLKAFPQGWENDEMLYFILNLRLTRWARGTVGQTSQPLPIPCEWHLQAKLCSHLAIMCHNVLNRVLWRKSVKDVEQGAGGIIQMSWGLKQREKEK